MPQRFAYRMRRLDEISPTPIEEFQQIKAPAEHSHQDMLQSFARF